MFFALSTQWRAGPMGGLLGLDYAAIQPALRLIGVPRGEWREIFEGLRLMERAAIKVMNERGHG